MKKSNDPVANKNLEMKEKERILKETSQTVHDFYTPSDETVRICRENEKKKPKRIPDDHGAYFRRFPKKMMQLYDRENLISAGIEIFPRGYPYLGRKMIFGEDTRPSISS